MLSEEIVAFVKHANTNHHLPLYVSGEAVLAFVCCECKLTADGTTLARAKYVESRSGRLRASYECPVCGRGATMPTLLSEETVARLIERYGPQAA